MATTAKITLSEQQIRDLAKDLRIPEVQVPKEVAIVAIAPEAGDFLGIDSDSARPAFSPAVIIT